MSLNPEITDWKNKTVWIIGASSGIGAETARLLLLKGARVALSARTVASLQTLAETAAPETTLIAPMDISQASEVEQAFNNIQAQWDTPDLTLVVAGTYQEMRAWDFDRKAASKLLDINLNGPLNVLDVLLPKLLKRAKGGLGMVASVAGYRGLPKALIYGASKAALINLTEALYFDLAPKGISVYLINPGFVDTPLTKNNKFSMPDLMTPQDAAKALVKGLEAGEFEITFPKSFVRKMKLAQLLPYKQYFAAVRRSTHL
ncbi:MAG: SDR family NAD(P)-dependent oxidoreductase [Burkholderiaceae bacterium]|nr:SDR family NAD(P)-dependent oxidoreductase [Burkholderiaceae bacterium]